MGSSPLVFTVTRVGKKELQWDCRVIKSSHGKYVVSLHGLEKAIYMKPEGVLVDLFTYELEDLLKTNYQTVMGRKILSIVVSWN